MIGKTNSVNVSGGLPAEALNLTGNIGYKFYRDNWNWFITNYSNQITTNNISGNYIFYYNTISQIPFTLNIGGDISYIFNGCSNLTTCPTFTGNFYYSRNMFSNCNRLRDIDGLSGITTCTKTTTMNGTFDSCYSLRTIPTVFLDKVQTMNYTKTSSASSNIYYRMFIFCTTLDEITNAPVLEKTITSSYFNSTFGATYRLKDLKFATDGGTPKTITWTNQTVDLSAYVGYVNSLPYVLNYNSGITADKQVTNASTYASLKNDPDWFTTDIAYSRYNHDSAVNTINSLPDTSAYVAAQGGTNTIKFKGASGSATDGGAINTLTTEEIAVATAKGWTVTLV